MSQQSENVKQWNKEALEKGATHFIDVCDTFDHSHYPVFVMPDQDVTEVEKEYRFKEMQVVYGTYEVAEKKTYVVQAFRSLNTYAKEWYEVEASSPEEAKALVYEDKGEYVDGSLGDVIDGEFLDFDDWEADEKLS